VWRATDSDGDSRVTVTIEWRTARLGKLSIEGEFSTFELGIDGDTEPFELNLSLGLGSPPYAGGATITHNQWRVRNERLWKGPNGEPPVFDDHDAPAAQLSIGANANGAAQPDPSGPANGANEASSDAPRAGEHGCNMPGGSRGSLGAWWLLVLAALGLVRHKRSA
jgi:MYXO-CTERM domain-containing protein